MSELDMMPVLQRTKIRALVDGNWTEDDTITAGCARRVLAWARRVRTLDKPCVINPSLTVDQALGIFERAVQPLGDDEPVRRLTAVNLLRTARGRKGHVL